MNGRLPSRVVEVRPMSDKTKRVGIEEVTLSTGVRVVKSFHDDLFDRIRLHIPHLRYGVPHQTKDLVCPRYWASLDTSDHWRIGCCVADWERKRRVPLRFVGCAF